MFFHMITLFLFLSLLILLIRIFSARLIIPAVGVFLPVSSLWMGFHMLTQNEISFITMALTAILVLKDSSNIWLNITFIALLLSIFVAIISVWG
ncbi:hypothetical protein EJW70_23990 [Escherichia coli]|nr:hypothetical protein [Escherichia coli]